MCKKRFTLQSMKNSLAQQRKFRPSIHHAFNQFQLVDFSFDQAIVLGKRETCYDRRFVALNPKDKAL